MCIEYIHSQIRQINTLELQFPDNRPKRRIWFSSVINNNKLKNLSLLESRLRDKCRWDDVHSIPALCLWISIRHPLSVVEVGCILTPRLFYWVMDAGRYFC